LFDRSIRNTRPIDAFHIFIAAREAVGCAPATLSAYRRATASFLALHAETPSPELDDDHITLWLAGLRRRGLADATLAWYQRHLYVFLRYMVARGWADPALTRTVPRVLVQQEPKRSVTGAQFARLLTVASDGVGAQRTGRGRRRHAENVLRNVAMLHVLWATGVRRREMVELELRDVDLKERVLIVRHAKGKKFRTVPFGADTKLALTEYIRMERGQEPGPLWLARGGEALTVNGLDMFFKRLTLRSGLAVSAHDLRRAFASRMRRSGLDLGHVMELLGHTSPVMTLHYSRAGEAEAARQAYRRLVG
jgi:site-specific recombinase XerD